MTDYFNMTLTDDDLRAVSSLGLAHIGDAVFELMVRVWLIKRGKATAKGLHSAAVRYVSAPAQAAAVYRLLPKLTREERDVYKRGRNTRANSSPKSATYEEYHAATGVEALFGFLYLSGETRRLGELFDKIIEGKDA